MIINHNISALNAHRQLGANQSATQNSLEKLSSGLRINKAGDDAAGLAISEKMRGQIRGLEMAQKNAQDGISLIQTAEGALNETHAILQRMRELAVQSSNDTNTDKDRAELQKEVDQLAQALTDISDDTEFNTQKLLDGSFEGTFHIGANSSQNLKVDINKMDSESLKVAGQAEGLVIKDVTKNVGTSQDIDSFGMTAGTEYNVTKFETAVKIGSDSYNYALTDDDGNIFAISEDGSEYSVLTSTHAGNVGDDASKLNATTITGAQVADFGDKVISGKVTATGTTGGGGTDFALTASEVTAQFDEDATALAAGEYKVVDQNHAFVDAGAGNRGLTNSSGDLVATSTDSGATWKDLEGNTILSVSNNTALSVGSTFTVSGGGGIDISSQSAADKAITTIQSAIDTVSAERSKLGAVQNRLDHTINNLGTSAENLTAAESRIRDVDMAKEMMEFTKNNILSQAAQSMLAQFEQIAA